jgi:hypothetical protein|tara:strand:+ start:61593 stop:62225 length:633 start_codon:yes stop_codon:yes gene_type:complete
MRKPVIILAVFLVIGFLGYTALSGSKEKASTKIAISAEERGILDETLDDMKQKAASYDENYQSLAMSRAASELAEDMLGAADDQKKLETAAGVFAGYMVRNTMGLKNYCGEKGVDVSAFTDAFKAQHDDIAKVAEKYYVIENQMQAVYNEMHETLAQMIDQEMRDVASMMGYKNNAQSCQWMNDNAQNVLQHARFEKAIPSAFAVLDGAK